eukprot:7279163-Pyramimonas_sp.AAC.1
MEGTLVPSLDICVPVARVSSHERPPPLQPLDAFVSALLSAAKEAKSVGLSVHVILPPRDCGFASTRAT